MTCPPRYTLYHETSTESPNKVNVKTSNKLSPVQGWSTNFMVGWNAPRLLLLARNRVPMAGLNMVSLSLPEVQYPVIGAAGEYSRKLNIFVLCVSVCLCVCVCMRCSLLVWITLVSWKLQWRSRTYLQYYPTSIPRTPSCSLFNSKSNPNLGLGT